MHPHELWTSRTPKARLLRAALLPLSGLYALGWQGYLGIYRLGLKRAKHPHSPILCVGNLVTGGSGKSPMTLHLVDVLRAMGREVVVGASGYGSPAATAARVADEGPLSAQIWGDEPAMFRWLRPDLPLIVGRRRVLAAELAHERFPNAVLLMDDGFQHLPLCKDISIVLDDAEPANRLCMPAGPYREGRWNRARADLVIPGKFKVVSQPLTFHRPDGEQVPKPSQFAALCALGQPDRFFAALGEPSPAIALPDHDPLQGGTLLDQLPKDRPTIVTAKDWVKLRERADIHDRPIVIAQHQVRVEPAAEFQAWLESRLNGR